MPIYEIAYDIINETDATCRNRFNNYIEENFIQKRLAVKTINTTFLIKCKSEKTDDVRNFFKGIFKEICDAKKDEKAILILTVTLIDDISKYSYSNLDKEKIKWIEENIPGIKMVKVNLLKNRK